MRLLTRPGRRRLRDDLARAATSASAACSERKDEVFWIEDGGLHRGHQEHRLRRRRARRPQGPPHRRAVLHEPIAEKADFWRALPRDARRAATPSSACWSASRACGASTPATAGSSRPCGSSAAILAPQRPPAGSRRQDLGDPRDAAGALVLRAAVGVGLSAARRRRAAAAMRARSAAAIAATSAGRTSEALRQRREHVAHVAVGHRGEDRPAARRGTRRSCRGSGPRATPAGRSCMGRNSRSAERISATVSRWASSPRVRTKAWRRGDRAVRGGQLAGEVQLDRGPRARDRRRSARAIAWTRKTCERGSTSRPGATPPSSRRRSARAPQVLAEVGVHRAGVDDPEDARRRAARRARREVVGSKPIGMPVDRDARGQLGHRGAHARGGLGRGHDDRRRRRERAPHPPQVERRCGRLGATRISSSAQGSSRSATHGTPSARATRAPANAVSYGRQDA